MEESREIVKVEFYSTEKKKREEDIKDDLSYPRRDVISAAGIGLD